MKTEFITFEQKTLAMIFYSEGEISSGVHFLTPNSNALQVGMQLRSKDEKVKPHAHLPVKIETFEDLQEVLFVERGKMKVNFYSPDGKALESRILNTGDIILLIRGGHSFEFLTETKLLEIKQGPYNPASRKDLDVQ